MSKRCRVVALQPPNGKDDSWAIVYADKILYHWENDGYSFMKSKQESDTEVSIEDIQRMYPSKVSEILEAQNQLQAVEILEKA